MLLNSRATFCFQCERLSLTRRSDQDHLAPCREPRRAPRLTAFRPVSYVSAMATRKTGSKRAAPKASYGPLAAKILEKWRGAGGESVLDRIVSELGDVPRYDVVAALKELQKAGAGEFLVGRGGQKPRFVWNARALSESAPRRAPAARAPDRQGR